MESQQSRSFMTVFTREAVIYSLVHGDWHCLKTDAVPHAEGYCELATLEAMTVTDAYSCSTGALGRSRLQFLWMVGIILLPKTCNE